MEKELDELIDKDFPPHLFEVMEFKNSLAQETDRGCALMVAAYLDQKLEVLLRAKFVDDQKTADEILSYSGPIGTFSSRIDVAYILGLVGPKVRRDLHLIRKIRNLFGHHHKPLSFNNDQISNRCSELFHCSYVNASPREVFVRTSIQILTTIRIDTIHTKRLLIGKDLYENDNEKKKDVVLRREIRNMVSKLSNSDQQKIVNKFVKIFNEKMEL